MEVSDSNLSSGDRSRKSVLFLMDTKNLHYSLTSLYGQGARIDFKKLKNNAQDGAGLIRAIAYVGNYKKDSDKFLGSLNKLGFEVVFFDKSATELISGYINENIDKYDEVVVSSGAGVLNETYKAYPGKFRVIVFPDSLHKETKNHAVIETLTADILMPPRLQNEANSAEFKLNPIQLPEEDESPMAGNI